MRAEAEAYARLLLEWNQSINLTGAKDQAGIEELIEQAGELRTVDWSPIGRAVDIGSGGGVPAIPLAIEMPQVRFTLVEANGRKAAFLRHVAGVLGLGNVDVLSERAELLARKREYRETFDRAVSRAAAPPPVLLELSLPLVRTGGDLLAQVGPLDPASLQHAGSLLGGASPTFTPVDGRHGVLRVIKTGPTPPEYPRRPGLPNRRPLT